jgi:cytochrome c oxidase subunit II
MDNSVRHAPRQGDLGRWKDNMNRSDRGPAVLALLVVMMLTLSHYATRAALTYSSGPGAGVSGNVKEIVMTAQKYDFNPEVITVKQNEHVKLVITALDHDHGFKIDALHIDQLLKQGEPTTIEFTADTTGTFSFQCSHFCGLGHKGMKGQLVVEAASDGSSKEQSDASAEQFSNH